MEMGAHCLARGPHTEHDPNPVCVRLVYRWLTQLLWRELTFAPSPTPLSQPEIEGDIVEHPEESLLQDFTDSRSEPRLLFILSLVEIFFHRSCHSSVLLQHIMKQGMKRLALEGEATGPTGWKIYSGLLACAYSLSPPPWTAAARIANPGPRVFPGI